MSKSRASKLNGYRSSVSRQKNDVYKFKPKKGKKKLKFLIGFICYIICGYCVGRVLGFYGIVDIILFPITAILRLIFRQNGKDD